MLRFEMDVAAADMSARTIEGVIVPYGEVATIQGRKYEFEPGSVTLARSRTPLLVDHDRGAPVGVLAELVEHDAGAVARFKVDPTPAGDTALVQAASGSRGSLSVGAELDDADDDGDVIHVRASSVHEVSLLALGAFHGASVTRVAAEADAGDEDPPPASAPTPPPAEDPSTEDPPATPAEQEGPEMEPIEAAAPVIIAERSRPALQLSAGEYVHAMLAAGHGDDAAARLIEAALTETVSTDIPGLLPPSYESRVLPPAPTPRVLYDTFKGRPLPAVGLSIQKPTWTTPPDGQWAANVDADATTSAAVIGLNAAAVERWDWATAISYTAAKRSSPDAIDTIYAAAVEDFYRDVETKIGALLIASAGAANAAVTLGAGIAAFYAATDLAPDAIIVAPDVWGELADAGVLTPAVGFVGANVIAGEGGLRSSYAGLPIVASNAVPATSKILATRRALDVRTTEPVQLTANAIGALNVELGVVGEGLFDLDYPGEVMLLTAGAPMVRGDTSESRARK